MFQLEQLGRGTPRRLKDRHELSVRSCMGAPKKTYGGGYSVKPLPGRGASCLGTAPVAVIRGRKVIKKGTKCFLAGYWRPARSVKGRNERRWWRIHCPLNQARSNSPALGGT